MLAPLLWNLVYDTVLRAEDFSKGASLTYYADDALLLAIGENWRRAIRRAGDCA